MRVTDRARFDPTALAVAILSALQATHSGAFEFRASQFDRLATGPELRLAIVAGSSAREIQESWEPALVQFRDARKKYLIY